MVLKNIFLALMLVFYSTTAAGVQNRLQQFNDYPTVARADYVFACMAANGQDRQTLEKCACSIDMVASILPYKAYVEAETVLSLSRVGGEKMSIFRTEARAQAQVADLRRAQAEAEIVCF